jgi:hypothetical protein
MRKHAVEIPSGEVWREATGCGAFIEFVSISLDRTSRLLLLIFV